MGTDIHLRVQKRKDSVSPWEFVEDVDKNGEPVEWHTERCYDAFAILADVRNHWGFNSIAPRRGIPEDIIVSDDLYLGDHSASWLLLSEIEAFDWFQDVEKSAELSALQYFRLKIKQLRDIYASPDPWCGGLRPPQSLIDNVEMDAKLNQLKSDGWQHLEYRIETEIKATTLASWRVYYSEAAGTFYTRLIPRLKRLAKDVGSDNVRIVFGFDS